MQLTAGNLLFVSFELPVIKKQKQKNSSKPSMWLHTYFPLSRTYQASSRYQVPDMCLDKIETIPGFLETMTEVSCLGLLNRMETSISQDFLSQMLRKESIGKIKGQPQN